MSISRFFRDDEGKLVLWQRPNIWIIIWALTALLRFFKLSHGTALALSAAGAAALTVWALLEIISGDSYFRRVLGAIVLALTITSILGVHL